MTKASRRQRRTVMAVIVVAELVVALLTGAGVVFAYNHVDSKIDEGAPIPHEFARPEPKLPTGAFNMLVIGTDTRDCEGCGIDKEGGLGGSDMTILLHVADGRRTAYGISIPRDTLVDRPECEVDGTTVPAAAGAMWNEALAVGGPTCTVAQVQSVTGIYVDDYIVVDFAGFKDMVDALDGVEVCIPSDIDDPEHNIHLAAGTRKLHGDDALAYVRQRTSTPNADLGRMKRQQAFIASMLNRVMSAETLTRPDKLLRFASALAGSIQTNPEIASVGELVDLASSLRKADLDKIRFVTAPTTDFPTDSPNWGRLQLTPEADELWQKVRDDEPLGSLGRGAISGRNPSGSKEEAAANGLCD
ncbi:LCP family protein [Nocardioides sp. LMS-CY]|uniref:LCP family protein required for cell wall assembly n=1 Tax=Nocardioides soli TaxID=1036020 RepID=A0A7W4VSI8_9ACTN|nr:LCP family protein [Nocardioides sp. LMS-CY]MBB3040589.1 LCP family protein required for cell wall assembly [Nocardioides soli]QWF23948.1 LCP family protein [Nocardioides sp. LMS-CY]